MGTPSQTVQKNQFQEIKGLKRKKCIFNLKIYVGEYLQNPEIKKTFLNKTQKHKS